MIPVLVITRDHDITADRVIAELHRRDIRTARFDLADFPERLTQVAYLVNGRTEWTGALNGHHRDVDLSAVRAVWWRKPSRFATHRAMTSTEQQWATAEADNGFGGLIAALPVAHWINHPHRNAAAEYKPHQLTTAAQCGLTVPDTLITNDPDQARLFCDTHPTTGTIYKPLRGGPRTEEQHNAVLRATPVTADGIPDSVRRTAHLFQERVPAAYAVRSTIVGERVFSARMDVPDGSGIDWRSVPADQVSYTPIDTPDRVVEGLRRLTAAFGLTYAAPDFIVTPSGDWIFHGDLNPNGQWGFIAARTDLPIAAAIADELTTEVHAA